MTIPVFEAGNTLQFTWTASVAPDAAPTLVITETLSDTALASITAQQSASTAYYALYTLPNTHGLMFVAEWTALKTIAGSAYQFVKRFQFRSNKTEAPV